MDTKLDTSYLETVYGPPDPEPEPVIDKNSWFHNMQLSYNHLMFNLCASLCFSGPFLIIIFLSLRPAYWIYFIPYIYWVIYDREMSKPVIYKNSLLHNMQLSYNHLTFNLYASLAFSGPFFLIIFLALHPAYWVYFIPYIFWIIYDRETPQAGGRKLAFFRKLGLWQYPRYFFPIKFVKTAELPPDRTYLVASFPHGFFCYGVQVNIGSDANHFDKAFPGLDPHIVTLYKLFNIPIIRDIALTVGGISSSKKSIKYVLDGPPGNMVVIVVGGAEEITRARKGTYRLVLKKRKGFVRVALQSGASLVPMFSFGETHVFDQPSGYWYMKLQSILKANKYPFLLWKGRGFFLNYLMPFKEPITTVVGKPIDLPKVDNPSQELVDKYHEIFVSELTQLFDKYKEKYDKNGSQATLSVEE